MLFEQPGRSRSRLFGDCDRTPPNWLEDNNNAKIVTCYSLHTVEFYIAVDVYHGILRYVLSLEIHKLYNSAVHVV